jgi:two-component system alkaline phosphatase synthesis response regulator PhoP
MADKILIVEDDPDIADLLEIHIGDFGYELDREEEGEAGLKRALSGDYQLVILDLMLPRLDGLEVCKRLRMAQVPILMLTSKSEEFDKVLGLELGADDYVIKPFGIRELMARIKAFIRRANAEEVREVETLVRGPLVVDLEKRRVDLRGERVELTAKEFDLLVLRSMGVRYHSARGVVSSERKRIL